MKKVIILIFLGISLFTTCRVDNSKEVRLDDYSVDISFSSFFDCGVFERIVLTSRQGSLTFGEKFKLNDLYRIKISDGCKEPKRDTLIVKTTKNQRDSIFDLANKYIDNVKFDNRVRTGDPIVKLRVIDGGNVEVKLCFENRCKTTSYSNYGQLKDVSTDLIGF